MINQILLELKAWRSKTIVVFIPKKFVLDEKDACAVFIAERLVKCRCPKILIDRLTKHFSDFITQGFPARPRRLAVFAHRDNNKTGFPFTIDGRRTVLLPRWWDKPSGYTYNFLYAHVCSGSHILSKDVWRNVFPNWLSYNKDLFILRGIQKSDDTWRSVFSSIVLEVRANKLDTIESRLKSVYENAISITYDTYNEDQLDKFTLMYLNNALESLTSNN